MISKRCSKLIIQYMRYTFATSHSVNFSQIANFNPETEELHKLVSKFADDVIAPLADKTEKENKFPPHIWKELGNLGLLGATVDPKYGGSGLNYTAHCMMVEEISRASGAIGLSYGAHSALCVAQIARHCNEQQKEKYLPKLCSGEHVGALAMSEVFAGSDVVSMKTTAVKNGNKFILNGSKMWITNGPVADVLFVYAKTSSGEKPGLSCFLIEKNFKGFKCAQKLDKLGMRGSDTGELVFEDCEVPEENLVGQLNKGVYVLMSGLDYERLVLAAGPVGIMQAAFDVSLDYMKQRQQFGKKIGEFQIMQAKIADMYTQLQSSRAMVYAIAKSVDEGQKISNRVNNDCASVILFTSTNATQLALEAIQTLGGNGYINEYPTGRFLRDAKLYEIGAGTNEIRRWLIGRELIMK